MAGVEEFNCDNGVHILPCMPIGSGKSTLATNFILETAYGKHFQYNMEKDVTLATGTPDEKSGYNMARSKPDAFYWEDLNHTAIADITKPRKDGKEPNIICVILNPKLFTDDDFCKVYFLNMLYRIRGRGEHSIVAEYSVLNFYLALQSFLFYKKLLTGLLVLDNKNIKTIALDNINIDSAEYQTLVKNINSSGINFDFLKTDAVIQKDASVKANEIASKKLTDFGNKTKPKLDILASYGQIINFLNDPANNFNVMNNPITIFEEFEQKLLALCPNIKTIQPAGKYPKRPQVQPTGQAVPPTGLAVPPIGQPVPPIGQAALEEKKDDNFVYLSLSLVNPQEFKTEINNYLQPYDIHLSKTEYHVTLYYKFPNNPRDPNRLNIFRGKTFNLKILSPIYIVQSIDNPSDAIGFLEVDIDTDDRNIKEIFKQYTKDASHITLFNKGAELAMNSGKYLGEIKAGTFNGKTLTKIPIPDTINALSQFRTVTADMSKSDNLDSAYSELLDAIQQHVNAIKKNNPLLENYSDALRPLFASKHIIINNSLKFKEIEKDLKSLLNPGAGTSEIEKQIAGIENQIPRLQTEIEGNRAKIAAGNLNEKELLKLENAIRAAETKLRETPSKLATLVNKLEESKKEGPLDQMRNQLPDKRHIKELADKITPFQKKIEEVKKNNKDMVNDIIDKGEPYELSVCKLTPENLAIVHNNFDSIYSGIAADIDEDKRKNPAIANIIDKMVETGTTQLKNINIKLLCNSALFADWSTQYYEWLDSISVVSKLTNNDANKQLQNVSFKIKSGVDDKKYKQFSALRKWLPRGIVFIPDPNDKNKWVLKHFAIRKFFGIGENEDQDEDQADEKQEEDIFDTKAEKEAAFFIPTIKANGENFQWSAYYDNGQLYFIVGSKHNKILVPIDEGNYLKILGLLGRMYPNRSLETKGAKIILTHLNNIKKSDPDKYKKIIKFMTDYNMTVNFEFEQKDYQHLELLLDSKMVFIGLSSVYLDGITLHPYIASKIGKYMGFKTVIDDFKILPIEQLQVFIKDLISENPIKEGFVINKINADGKVVALSKIKTVWYIIYRKARGKILEFSKNPTPEKLEEIKQYLGAQIKSLRFGEKEDISLTQSEIDKWTSEINRFYDYMSKLILEIPIDKRNDFNYIKGELVKKFGYDGTFFSKPYGEKDDNLAYLIQAAFPLFYENFTKAMHGGHSKYYYKYIKYKSKYMKSLI